MTILLNIGLNTPSGDPVASLGMERIYEAGKLLETFRKSVALHVSDTEETLVVECDDADLEYEAHKLCELLDQDCVAIFNTLNSYGVLIGPRAHEWGEFDPTKFLLLDGSRAAPLRPFDWSTGDPAAYSQGEAHQREFPCTEA